MNYPSNTGIKIAGYFGKKQFTRERASKDWNLIHVFNEPLFLFLADDDKTRITVRGCALDSGTLTTDTEIIRMSHCGKFYYDDRWVCEQYMINLHPFSVCSLHYHS